MKAKNTSRGSFRQENSIISDRSLVRKTSKQIAQAEAKEQRLIALGQFGIGLLNLIQQVDKKLGLCIFSLSTMATMLGCHRDTVAVKLKALLDMGLVKQRLYKKRGYKKTMEKWAEHPSVLKRLLQLLSVKICSIVTMFSINPTRLSIELYLYLKNKTTDFNFATFSGGVPPDVHDIDITTNKTPLTYEELMEICDG